MRVVRRSLVPNSSTTTSHILPLEFLADDASFLSGKTKVCEARSARAYSGKRCGMLISSRDSAQSP
jgi:hypothetical protein